MTESAPIEYHGERVRVWTSDNADMPDALVVTIAPPPEPADWGAITFEISRNEARELIAGLAALL
jgi:hypothetical protein